MKKKYLWMMAAILVCGAMTVSISLSSCEKANAQEDNPAPKVESTELIRTSQSWDGVELPDYLQGRPELVAVKYVFPVGQKLGWHHHPVMNYGVLMQGELTIIGQDGKKKVVHEGEPVVEMVGCDRLHPDHRWRHTDILRPQSAEMDAGGQGELWRRLDCH